jgi:hypothetical protein
MTPQPEAARSRADVPVTVAAPRASQPGLFAALVVRPRQGVRMVLEHGSPLVSSFAILLACAVAMMNAARLAGSTNIDDFLYGPSRSPAVTLLLDTIGTARTTVVVYLAQQVWVPLILLTATAPLFVWILGASAVHAAASLAQARRHFNPLFVFFGYATALALVPAGLISVLLRAERGSLLAALDQLAGFALLVWLGFLVHRAVETYYEVNGSRAFTILLVALTLFYLVPLVLIAAAAVAIVVAAIVLELA